MKPRAKKKRAPKKVTTAAIVEVLRSSYGIVTDAARKLRLDPAVLRARVRADAELQQAQRDGQEIAVDEAEEGLIELVDDGDLQATIFMLRTLGKKRGYVERQELDAANGNGSLVFYIPKKDALPEDEQLATLPPDVLDELDDGAVVH